MELKLAVVLECDPEGCQVQDVTGGQAYFAAYSALARDRVFIHPRQLVVIDAAAHPPEIVWRWHRVQVLEVKPEGVVVALRGEYSTATTVPELPVEVAPGDEVWATGAPNGFEIHDLIVDERPAHPESLLAYIKPVIDKVYHQA